MKSKIDYKEITKLIDLLEQKKISDFELEVEGLKISIGRNRLASPATEYIPPAAQPTTVPQDTSTSKITAEEPADDLMQITSPMVGTFYRAPDPSAPSFVEIGESVSKGQTLCIIEAMKLMNEIEAEGDGVIEQIYCKNGKPVEYGQKLFAIKLK